MEYKRKTNEEGCIYLESAILLDQSGLNLGRQPYMS